MEFHNINREAAQKAGKTLPKGVLPRLSAGMAYALPGYALSVEKKRTGAGSACLAFQYVRNGKTAARVSLDIHKRKPDVAYMAGLSGEKYEDVMAPMLSVLAVSGFRYLDVCSVEEGAEAFFDHPGLELANIDHLRKDLLSTILPELPDGRQGEVIDQFRMALARQSDENFLPYLRSLKWIEVADFVHSVSLRDYVLAGRIWAGMIPLKL